ncbi:heptosyltransferase-2 [Lishizhenia tianjinensis]|uniref:Heptosyltransferase-2 n=1 Tax=Lishizhenia tianjinensis TaxID=477690 RepID=A0A1I6Y4N5_9FLAO|nr:glycosyltransferase family 9 protein [Lishizhenia tianjinensis]SFT45201.1 heptosyltransferase-2 [Lishizhenia tianjinensis]
MNYSDIKFDCLYFKQELPCKPHKEQGVSCIDCSVYKPIQKRVLIVKLGALGDVIRTTPLMKALEEKYGTCHFTWITHSPAIIENTRAQKVIPFNGLNFSILQFSEFDIVINLDKEKEACLLATHVKAPEKFGFYMNGNQIDGYNAHAQEKILTGVDDGISQLNTKSYLEEIFNICELKFDYQEYEINLNHALVNKWNTNFNEIKEGKTIIGLNTGCGPRWKTRLWPIAYWVELAKNLREQGYFVLLLGGSQEDEQNKQIASESGAHYAGHFSLEEFIALSANVDVVVTQVSMMMHIATALQKKMVLMNNIFNKHEFELYKRGVIVEPSSSCDCFYGVTCSRERSCMKDISVEEIATNVNKLAEVTA